MGKVKKENEFDEIVDDEIVDFKVQSVSPPPVDTFAVYDEGGGDWAVFPVVLFALGALTIKTGAKQTMDIPNTVCGMVSNVGGLVIVEHAVDLKFIGYWRKECQPFKEFLEDHEVDDTPEFDDAESEDEDGEEG